MHVGQPCWVHLLHVRRPSRPLFLCAIADQKPLRHTVQRLRTLQCARQPSQKRSVVHIDFAGSTQELPPHSSAGPCEQSTPRRGRYASTDFDLAGSAGAGSAGAASDFAATNDASSSCGSSPSVAM